MRQATSHQAQVRSLLLGCLDNNARSPWAPEPPSFLSMSQTLNTHLKGTKPALEKVIMGRSSTLGARSGASRWYMMYAKPLDHILWTVSAVCHPTFVDFYFFVFFMLIFHAHVFWHTTAFYTDVNYLLHTSYRPQAPSIALPSPPSLPQLHILLLQIHPSAWLIEPNEMILDLISHLWTLRISLNHPNYPNTALAHPLSLSIVLLKILAFKTLCMHHTPFRGGL